MSRIAVFGLVAVMSAAAGIQDAAANQSTRFLNLLDASGAVIEPCVLAPQGSMSISPSTGDITVTVADLDDCVGSADALNVSPILTTPSPVQAGTALTVLWTSVGAVTCTPSTASTLPGWSSQPLGLQGPRTFTVGSSTAAGSYNLGVSCSDGSDTLTSAATVQVTAADPGSPPPTPSLTVNQSTSAVSINPGQTLTLAWSSTSATACQASGTLPGWSGSKAVSGSQTISNTSGFAPGSSFTATLVCSNAAGNSPGVTRTINITDPTPIPSQCSERPLLGQGSLSNWTRKTTGQNSCSWCIPGLCVGLNQAADCRQFSQVWPLPWPGGNSSRNLTISSGERGFIAMQFDSGNIPSNAQAAMTQELPQFGAQAANKLWSISKCPGDYNKALIDAEMGPGCIKRDMFGSTDSFLWGGPSFFNDASRCALQPNTTYFLNIVWTNALPGTDPESIQLHPTCETNRCGGIFAPGGSLYTP